MALPNADIGTGCTIGFSASSFTAEITGINGSDISREAIDTSHMGTTGEKTKLPGDLFDAGSVEFEIAFKPGEEPPIADAPETLTVTFPLASGDATPANVAGTGFCTGWSWGAPLEDKMTATFTWTWDGGTGPTWTPAA